MSEYKDIKDLWKQQDSKLDTNLKMNKEKMNTLLTKTMKYHFNNISISYLFSFTIYSYELFYITKGLIKFWGDSTIRNVCLVCIGVIIIFFGNMVAALIKINKISNNGMYSMKQTQEKLHKLMRRVDIGGAISFLSLPIISLSHILRDLDDASEFKAKIIGEIPLAGFMYLAFLICAIAYSYSGHKTDLEETKIFVDKMANEEEE